MKRAKRKRRRGRGKWALALIAMIGFLVWISKGNLWPFQWDEMAGGIFSEDALYGAGDATFSPPEGCPDSLRELYEKNPETKDFVENYFEERDKHHKIDLSKELKEGEIPLLLQWDKRWGYELYGTDMMAITGCGPTCLSMVICGLTGDTTWHPLKVARAAQENGYYVEGSGSSWTLMSEGAGLFGLNSWEFAFDEAHIRETLREGHPIICAMGPGDFTTAGHFIVLCGEDADGNILVHDPNSRMRSRGWELREIMGQVRAAWAFAAS